MEVELPVQLQRQIADVEAYDRQLEEANTPPTDAAPPPPATPPAAPVPTEPAVVPPAPAKDDEATYKARYLSLQGMFNAEVPRLNTQVKDLQKQLGDLQAQLIAAKSTPPAPERPASSITPKDIEAYGPDLIDLIQRQSQDQVAQARAEWARERAALEGQVAELSKNAGTVAERQATNDRERYFAALASQVPDYAEINVNPGFLAWMAETDPLSGLARQAYLDNAFAKFDAVRTATLFNTWKGLQPPPAPAPGKTLAQQQLERQVAPGGSRTTPTPTPDGSTRVWTAAEVDKFYRDAGRGAYRGREAEYARIDAEIDLAAASGRVTQ